MFKLGRLEILTMTSDFALNLDILLDQVVLVTKLKRSSANLVKKKSGTLSQQQDIVSQSKKCLAYWEVKIHDENALVTLDNDI